MVAITMDKKSERTLLKKVPVWLMIVLTIFSLGVYLGFWLLNRKDDLNDLQPKNHIPFTLWTISAILLVIFFFLQTFNQFIFTNIGYLYVESIDIIFSFFFVGLLYYSVFRIREMIEDNSAIRLNKFLLFFFHVFYIQYKVNRNAVIK